MLFCQIYLITAVKILENIVFKWGLAKTQSRKKSIKCPGFS